MGVVSGRCACTCAAITPGPGWRLYDIRTPGSRRCALGRRRFVFDGKPTPAAHLAGHVRRQTIEACLDRSELRAPLHIDTRYACTHACRAVDNMHARARRRRRHGIELVLPGKVPFQRCGSCLLRGAGSRAAGDGRREQRRFASRLPQCYTSCRAGFPILQMPPPDCDAYGTQQTLHHPSPPPHPQSVESKATML